MQGFGAIPYQTPTLGAVPAMDVQSGWQPLGGEAERLAAIERMRQASDKQNQQMSGMNSQLMQGLAPSSAGMLQGPGIGAGAGLAQQGSTFAGVQGMAGGGFGSSIPSAYAAAPNYFGATGGMANIGQAAGGITSGGSAGSGAAGAAGGVGLGTVASIALPAAAMLGMMNWEANTGTNSWGDHFTDPGGSALRRGDMHYDWLSDKGGKVGGYFGQPLRGIGRIASLRPREMWGGVRDLVSPITKIADLWS